MVTWELLLNWKNNLENYIFISHDGHFLKNEIVCHVIAQIGELILYRVLYCSDVFDIWACYHAFQLVIRENKQKMARKLDVE